MEAIQEFKIVKKTRRDGGVEHVVYSTKNKPRWFLSTYWTEYVKRHSELQDAFDHIAVISGMEWVSEEVVYRMSAEGVRETKSAKTES